MTKIRWKEKEIIQEKSHNEMLDPQMQKVTQSEVLPKLIHSKEEIMKERKVIINRKVKWKDKK
jgi:hypothetical protein